MRSVVRLPCICGTLAVAAVRTCLVDGTEVSTAAEAESDPPQVALGERLFLEPRCAQHFFARCRGDVNAVVSGYPVVADLETTDGSRRGPFRDTSISCRQCHLVDDSGGGRRVRTYADFARRGPNPDRGDGLTTTLRNSPSLVGMSRRHFGKRPLLHFDGEFPTAEDLVAGTFTGRNFGWLPSERDVAIRHIARVLRGDDGRGELAREFGGRYRDVLKGESSSIPSELKLPHPLRVHVDDVSDEQLVRADARLVAAYLRSLDYARDELGCHVGSPYDVFLKKNDLPQTPLGRETPNAYGARLLRALERLRLPSFVDGFLDGDLTLHGAQGFVFGPRELRGLKTFLRGPELGATSSVGNLASCQSAPEFSDFSFHTPGVSQLEYDRHHGDGSFIALVIPGLAERDAVRDEFLPATAAHPAAKGPFAAVPSASTPRHADLGLWNVLFDPERPRAQANLLRLLTAQMGSGLDDAALFDRSLAAFKTPSLRDLGQSAPYLHDGSADTKADAVRFHVHASDLARQSRMRNAETALVGIRLDDGDVRDLAAFLSSLDEDYE